jgi:hypothetical protein
MKMKWLVLSVAVFGLYASRGLLDLNRASAQIDNYTDSACFPLVGVSCPSCPNSFGDGCANPTPATWTCGTCEDGDRACSEWVAFNCGFAIECTTKTPIDTCGTHFLCK